MKYIIAPKKYLRKYRKHRKKLVISMNKAMNFSVIEFFSVRFCFILQNFILTILKS